ncbi:MAG: type VI secretion system membrane subunit TssM, partial [Gammaproteobacteria bacterium]|nr:type VI secretion system membrane subunit TssM [Gammaproteobacteria bacterium]
MNILTLINKIPAKIKANVLILIIVFLWIGLALPLIPIGNSHPFASYTARLLIFLLVTIAWLVKMTINFFEDNKEKTLPIIKEKSQLAAKKIKAAGQRSVAFSKHHYHYWKFRFTQERKRRRLCRLPWYLVLGTPQSGKKTMIKNTGLYFSRPEHFGDEAINYINQFPNFDWWFSEQAVMLDIMRDNNDQDMLVWKQFIKLLKRERQSKPINGILLNFSLPDLILLTNKARQEFIQSICQYIRDIHSTFKSYVPVYIIFNKCDLVAGFGEFFNDLSHEEIKQAWGINFPLAKCNDLQFVQTLFNQRYAALVCQLRQHIMWSLDAERSSRGRELINAFAQQMQLLKRPIENFILELFAATRYPYALQLRGIYFVSCTQENGYPHDFLLHAMSKKFRLVPPKFQRPQRIGQCYFMRNLFLNTIYPEGFLLGNSERSKRLKSIFYRVTLLACPLLLITITWGTYQGYQQNLLNLNKVDQHIAMYQQQLRHTNTHSDSLTAILPLLNQLNKANKIYNTHSTWGADLLLANATIHNTLKNTLQRTLHSLYIPRVAAQIEQHLKQNIQDQNLLYATLKGYLVFNANGYTDSSALKA